MKIGFIGAGNMANVMVNSLLKSKLYQKSDIYITDNDWEKLNAFASKYQIQVSKTNIELTYICDVIFLAVKPYNIKTVSREIKEFVGPSKIVISMAVGLTLETLGFGFEDDTKIVRMMPNVATLVSEGMTAFSYNNYLLEEDKKNVEDIFHCFGKAVELDETHFDSFSAICGSSPAFVFMFIQALAESGVAHGMDYKSAVEMVSQAVMGSAKMILETKEYPEDWINKVCTKGGTTMEGVKVLNDHKFNEVIMEAVSKTIDRSKELSKE